MVLRLEGNELKLISNTLENIDSSQIIIDIPPHKSTGKRFKLFLNDNALEEIRQHVYKINIGYFKHLNNVFKLVLYTATSIETFETIFDLQFYFSLDKQGHEKLPDRKSTRLNSSH